MAAIDSAVNVPIEQSGYFHFYGHAYLRRSFLVRACDNPAFMCPAEPVGRIWKMVVLGLCIIIITPSSFRLLWAFVLLICSLNPVEGLGCGSNVVSVLILYWSLRGKLTLLSPEVRGQCQPQYSIPGAGKVSVYCSRALQSWHLVTRMEPKLCPEVCNMY